MNLVFLLKSKIELEKSTAFVRVDEMNAVSLIETILTYFSPGGLVFDVKASESASILVHYLHMSRDCEINKIHFTTCLHLRDCITLPFWRKT